MMAIDHELTGLKMLCRSVLDQDPVFDHQFTNVK